MILSWHPIFLPWSLQKNLTNSLDAIETIFLLPLKILVSFFHFPCFIFLIFFSLCLQTDLVCFLFLYSFLILHVNIIYILLRRSEAGYYLYLILSLQKPPSLNPLHYNISPLDYWHLWVCGLQQSPLITVYLRWNLGMILFHCFSLYNFWEYLQAAVSKKIYINLS